MKMIASNFDIRDDSFLSTGYAYENYIKENKRVKHWYIFESEQIDNLFLFETEYLVLWASGS